MRWIVLSLVVVLVGCANGKILDAGGPHDETSSFLSAKDHPARIRPLYGNSRTWTQIPPEGLWVSEGRYVVQDVCIQLMDVEQPEVEIYIPGGHRYGFGCAGKDGLETVLKDLDKR